jgi:uncharacterized protein
MEIPWERIPAETLRKMAENYILREGTDYGQKDFSIEEKTRQVIGQLKRKEAVIVFDPETESFNILPGKPGEPL